MLLADFDMSSDQKDHIATVERLAPSLSALRKSLCPNFMSEESFWKIYFVHLHPKLTKLESESLLTHKARVCYIFHKFIFGIMLVSYYSRFHKFIDHANTFIF